MTETRTCCDPATTDCGRETGTVLCTAAPLFKFKRIGVLYSFGTPSG